MAALLCTHYYLPFIKKPALHYVKIAAAVLLMFLIWFSNTDGSIGMTVILSSVVATYAIKEIVALVRAKSNK